MCNIKGKGPAAAAAAAGDGGDGDGVGDGDGDGGDGGGGDRSAAEASNPCVLNDCYLSMCTLDPPVNLGAPDGRMARAVLLVMVWPHRYCTPHHPPRMPRI